MEEQQTTLRTDGNVHTVTLTYSIDAWGHFVRGLCFGFGALGGAAMLFSAARILHSMFGPL